jgi:hypothetical protein
MRWQVLVSGAIGGIGLAVAWAAEPVAVITEIGPGSGVAARRSDARGR